MFAGRSAGICYMKDSFDQIEAWSDDKAMELFEKIGKSGHHSVAGHTSYNLVLSGIPKIIAMILNNERDYNTSEKSARYTRMATSGDEKRLYDKWFAIFYEAIRGTYHTLEDRTIESLAKENARYFISVFTPATTMEYTVDFRQGNYLIQFLEDYAEIISESNEPFDCKLRPWLIETAKLFRSVFNCDELREGKGRGLSLFAKRERHEQFGESYSVNYKGSFAQLAQAQRHRKLKYEMMVPDLSEAEFFVPPILPRGVVEQYLKDMESVKADYPQGMLVKINEQGCHDDFITSKCTERLCGSAQLEICRQTRMTLNRYIYATCDLGLTDIYDELRLVRDKTKCQMDFVTQKCTKPCPLGQANAFTRRI